MSDCQPRTWFLSKDDEKGTFLTGLKTDKGDLTAEQLLSGRKECWKNSMKKLRRETLNSNSPLLQVKTSPLLYSFTSENLVIALVDGKEYMVDLSHRILGHEHLEKRIVGLGEIQKTSPDFLLITGWEFWKERYLDKLNKALTLGEILKIIAMGGKGREGETEIRLLSWENDIPFASGRTSELVDTVNSWYPGSKVAHRDNAGTFISHHQKSVFVGHGGDFDKSCAYVGGMDLAIDRWDDERHERSKREDTFYGWHDVQVRVQGDAITQIWANFLDRWNSRSSRKIACPIPSWTQHSKSGKQHVQVLRTVASARSSKPNRFMPSGERTVLCALKKAISQAECYIYIEEQFLWYCEIADFIHDRKKELSKLSKKLRLIVVLAAETELKGPVGLLGEHTYHLRSEFFMKVMGDLTDKAEIEFGKKHGVYVYGLYQAEGKRKPIYVHSKLIIIDDRYVAIGSANVDERSMHVDTELTLGIVDGDTVDGWLDGQKAKLCRFAVDLRQKLWKEHLGISKFTHVGPPNPIAELQDFPGVKKDWPANEKIAKTGRYCPDGHISLASLNTCLSCSSQTLEPLSKHHVRCYLNRPGRELLTAPAARLLDRQERRFQRRKKWF